MASVSWGWELPPKTTILRTMATMGYERADDAVNVASKQACVECGILLLVAQSQNHGAARLGGCPLGRGMKAPVVNGTTK